MQKIENVIVNFISRPDIFADVFNFWLYNGRSMIRSDDLSDLNPLDVGLPYGEGFAKPAKGYGDIFRSWVVKKDSCAIYILLGTAGEPEEDMPVHSMVCESLTYASQLSEDMKKLANYFRRRRNSIYIEGLKEDVYLLPVVTLVIYFGPDEWSAPVSIHDMIDANSNDLLKYVPDYKVNIILPSKLKDEDFAKFSTELGCVLRKARETSDIEEIFSEYMP